MSTTGIPPGYVTRVTRVLGWLVVVAIIVVLPYACVTGTDIAPEVKPTTTTADG